MPITISNPSGMTCREQVLYWLDAANDATQAGIEEDRVNAVENQATWISLENHFGPDAVLADLTVISDDEIDK